MNGITSDAQLEDVVREPDASWVIPTEDEWYEAAYHKNDGVPESDIRGIRGGSWFWGRVLMRADERPIDMHSSDEFSDLGFRVATLASTSAGQPVPALSDAGAAALLFGMVLGGALVIRSRAETAKIGLAAENEMDRSRLTKRS